MVRTGYPLSPQLSPQALWGLIPWPLGIWDLYCSIWNSRAEIEARKFFVGEQSPYRKSVKGKKEGGGERKGKAPAELRLLIPQ